MFFEIGDTVVHWSHGLGKVVAIEERIMAGIPQQYYVVEVGLLQIWVPIIESVESSIRYPRTRIEFMELFEILRTPGEVLSNRQNERKNELRERLRDRTLEGLCRVIRDLSDRERQHPLNQNDKELLTRMIDQLLDEWVLSLGGDRIHAKWELNSLLEEKPSIPVDNSDLISSSA